MKPVYCSKCYQEIRTQGDLFTYLSPTIVSPRCARCVLANQRGFGGGVLPINSSGAIFVMVCALIVCTLFAIRHFSWVWVVTGLALPFVRLWSWFWIERKVPLWSDEQGD